MQAHVCSDVASTRELELPQTFSDFLYFTMDVFSKSNLRSKNLNIMFYSQSSFVCHVLVKIWVSGAAM